MTAAPLERLRDENLPEHWDMRRHRNLRPPTLHRARRSHSKHRQLRKPRRTNKPF
jgi:hypothetical protein